MNMKTKFVFSCLALVFILSSCNKEADDPNITSFEFTFKEKDYKWSFNPDGGTLQKGARVIKRRNQNTNQEVYVLDGWNYPDGITMQCILNTSVLAVGTFSVTTSISDPYINGVFEIDGISYGSQSGDAIYITISKKSGNYVSGYFNAVMHDMRTSTSEVRIYKGYFSNIIIQE
jgi:hypothetical protein